MSDLLQRLQTQQRNTVAEVQAARVEVRNRLSHLKRKGREQCDEAKMLVVWREKLVTQQEELAAGQLVATSNVDTNAAAELRSIADRLDHNAANQQAIAHSLGSSTVEMAILICIITLRRCPFKKSQI